VLNFAILLQAFPLNHEEDFNLLRANEFLEVFTAVSERIVIDLFGAIPVLFPVAKKAPDAEVGLVISKLSVLKGDDNLV
jgi:hypothetical protein